MMTPHPHRARPDDLDKINAFRAGWRHGADRGEVSPREADAALRALPTTIPIIDATVACFCHGSVDGTRGDSWRYLLCHTVAP